MTLQAALYHNRRRRRTAYRVDQYDALISTNHDIGASAVELPAAGTIAVSASIGVTAGDLSIATTLASRTIETPDLDADQIYELGFFEKGDTLDVTFSGGDVTLYILNDWQFPVAFAEGTFA